MEIVEPPLTIAQPAVTVEDISDPTTVNAGIELIDQDAVQLQSQPLRARRVIVRLEAATVVFHSSNLRLRTARASIKGLLAYVTFGPQAKGTVNGLPVRPGMMLAAAPESEARFVVDAGWESIDFLLPPQDISAHLAPANANESFACRRGSRRCKSTKRGRGSSSTGGSDWWTPPYSIPPCSTRARPSAAPPRSSCSRPCWRPSTWPMTSSPPAATGRDRRRASIVKIAEDHALSQTGATIYVTDLCKAAGVSERTLEYAFKEVMGLTPVAYLIRLRLHRVRQALLAAHPGSTTVSAEALRLGFLALRRILARLQGLFR